jgi:23S rRNA (adenine2503-C2)-methyltransferase
MTNLAKAYRAELEAAFDLTVPEVVSKQVSLDGTRKYLMRIAGGHEVEVVYIPEEDRGTLCISSQVGCTLTCSFCHTGTQKLVRNLTAGEIVGQVMVARDDLDEWPRPGEGSGERPRLISNIVLMGMGEPLYNFENVRDAMKIAMDGEGIAISRRRITLSTSAWCPRSRAAPRKSAACWRCRSMPRRTRCATGWCRSTSAGTSRRCWTRSAPIPRRRIPSGSPSNT